MMTTRKRLGRAHAWCAVLLTCAGLPAQIQNLDGPWQFGLYPEAQVGNAIRATRYATPASGTHVKLQAWSEVAEDLTADSFSGVQCNAHKPLTVGPRGRRLVIDTRLRGELFLGDDGGTAHVKAFVSLFRFNDPSRGPAGGVTSVVGPPSMTRSDHGTRISVDRSESFSVWLEPGEYTLTVRLRATTRMTSGVGGDHVWSKFAGWRGGDEDRFEATFREITGTSMPRGTLTPFGHAQTRQASHGLGAALRGGLGYDPGLPAGIARSTFGSYYVTAPGLVARFAGLAVIDEAGGFRRTIPLPPLGPTRVLIRANDLAVAPATSLRGTGVLAQFVAGRVHWLDTVSETWDSARAVELDPSVPVRMAAALAFDPDGDQGRGTLWLGGASGQVAEVSRAGALLRLLPLPAGISSLSGASYDPTSRSIWWLGRDLGGRPTAFQTLTADGAPSGRRLRLDDLETSAFGLVPGDVAPGLGGAGLLFGLASGFGDLTVEELELGLEYGSSCGSHASYTGSPARGDRLVLELRGSHAALAAPIVALAPCWLAVPGIIAADCGLLVDPDPAVVLPTVPLLGGPAQAPIDVPWHPAIGGTRLFVQWVELGPSLPLRTSTGAALTIR